MKIDIKIKDKDSKTVTGAFGVTDEMLIEFLLKLVINPSDSVSESVMAQSKNENFGQIIATFASMYINRELHDVEKKLGAMVTEGSTDTSSSIQ